MTCSREIAAGGVRPGARLVVGQAQITDFLALDAEPELVIVVVNNPAPVQGQGGVGGDAGLEMEIADAAEGSGGDLMLLLELGAVAADKGLPRREINPVVVGVGAALELCSGVSGGGVLVSAAARPAAAKRPGSSAQHHRIGALRNARRDFMGWFFGSESQGRADARTMHRLVASRRPASAFLDLAGVVDAADHYPGSRSAVESGISNRGWRRGLSTISH